MMLPGLLLMYLQDIRILSASTFASTSAPAHLPPPSAETLGVEQASSPRAHFPIAPGLAPDVPTNLRILSTSISTSTIAYTHRPCGDQCMMHKSLLLMYLQNLHILSTSTFAYTARAETSA